MTDHSMMKLGRKAIKTDSRTLALGRYLKPSLPAPPPAKDWTKGITQWGAMLNDARDYWLSAPWALIFPGVAITLLEFLAAHG